MGEPVAATFLAAGEHLQVIRAVEAATHQQADDHDHHPRGGAGDDQHGEGRHALHQVGREAPDEDEGNRHHTDQQRGLDPRQHPREHAGHVQAGAVQRSGAGGHAADHRDQAHRQEEPARRYRQQAADIVVGRDVVRCLDRYDSGGDEAEQERNQRGELRGNHRHHDPAFGRITRDVARPVTEERTEGDRVAHGDQCCPDERSPESGLAHGYGAGVLTVECRGESENAQQEQQAGRPHRNAVDPQHEAETIDAHGQYQQREQTVGQAQGQIGFR
ncbi:hypothetical protein D3C80_965730 [compost metagenome]